MLRRKEEERAGSPADEVLCLGLRDLRSLGNFVRLWGAASRLVDGVGL